MGVLDGTPLWQRFLSTRAELYRREVCVCVCVGVVFTPFLVVVLKPSPKRVASKTDPGEPETLLSHFLNSWTFKSCWEEHFSDK